ncbi:hypothetical protein G846_01463 [Escherichia coli HVH 194 (4-2356805)]|nr:hypothetical protein G846_01463 [Escherichia coli HVH 194 (4-2356805)]
MRLASRFGYAANQIRRDRPLTHEELMHLVPGYETTITQSAWRRLFWPVL